MSTMVKVKAAELIGAALDWAVAKSLGFTVKISAYETDYWHSEDFGPCWYNGPVENYRPSTDWSRGGPLLDEHRIELRASSVHNWYADKVFPCGSEENDWCGFGNTALVAVCRAIVSAKMGDEVEVPKELLS